MSLSTTGYYLQPEFDSRASFYGKARVKSIDKHNLHLFSYDTHVASIFTEQGIKKAQVHGTYSQTTMRHIKEFPLQNGFKAKNQKQIIADYSEPTSDAERLTRKLVGNCATRRKIINIIDGYGDSVDWSDYSLDSIIAEVWESDLNSGDEPKDWIINEICRQFNIKEVEEKQ